MGSSMNVAALCCCILLSCALVASAIGPETDEIKDLPGAPPNLNFRQYSGYAEVNRTNGRNLFYWFVESQSKSSKDPLVMWLNGGPGCSSLGGFITEHGPFRPNKDNTLKLNDHAWNKVANVLYLESPAGVGFSYSKTLSDYHNAGDKRSADDIVSFLTLFLDAYPEYKGRPFFISGESYGGHYVPTTARAVVEHNLANASAAINLQGILVGNAWTLPGADNLGIVQTWLGYNLIQTGTGKDVMQYCNLSNMLPIKEQALLGVDGGVQVDPAHCQLALASAGKQTGNINPYDIYEQLCLDSETGGRSAFLAKMAQSSAPLSTHAKKLLVSLQDEDVNPCESTYGENYLNLASVQTAIHARPTKWSECNMLINQDYSRTDFLASMVPVHEFLLQHDIRVFIFSGDVDAVVPTHGTRNWIATLVGTGAISESKAWEPWTDTTQQVGGYVVRYGRLFTFATVRGAGHMVPATQPLRSLDMFRRYLVDAF